MSLQKPSVKTSRPFGDQFKEGETFVLDGIRTVAAKTEYGEGTMVLLNIRGYSDELSIWGIYLIQQADSAEEADFGKRYRIVTGIVDGFSKRPVKQLVPYNPREDEDIPF